MLCTTDHRYTNEVCSECGDAWCAGCENADVDRDDEGECDSVADCLEAEGRVD